MVAITGNVIFPHEVQLHLIKEAGAHGVVTPLTLPHNWLRTTRPSLLLTPLCPHNFPLLASHFPTMLLFRLLYLYCCCRCCFCLYRKPQHEQRKEQEPKRPHIKKPLNAFMLYMKEMRANVVAECTLKESAAINQILGRRVGAAT